MDDEQLLELLTQIAELAGVGIEALMGEQGSGEGPPPEGAAPPAEEPPA